MKTTDLRDLTLFEHHFWLQILGDHARFIYQALSPNESTYRNKSNDFIRLFDSLLEKSHSQLSEFDLSSLNHEAYNAALDLREFKLVLLAKLIVEKVEISLPPTFFNHMVNELEEYLYILNAFLKNNIRDESDIKLHLLWLLDGAGHASAVATRLDDTEKELVSKSDSFEKQFVHLYLKSIEFNGYTRTGLHDFHALRNLNEMAYEKMTAFKEFLKELEVGVSNKRILGTLSPLMTDHMIREECYYLIKLSMVSNLMRPNCDPGKPRIES